MHAVTIVTVITVIWYFLSQREVFKFYLSVPGGRETMQARANIGSKNHLKREKLQQSDEEQ